MSNRRTSILFLCTGNSARSILAEAIANEIYGDDLQAFSAGSQPKGQPDPLALRTLERHGLPAAGLRSKSWDEFDGRSFDLVVTLCDSAAKESCPVFPGAPVRCHWGLPDPPSASDPAGMFERVFEGLLDALGHFTMLPDYDIRAKAELVRQRLAARFPDA